MKKAICFMFICAFLFSINAFAEENYPDQYEAGPEIYTRIFDNERMRVSEIKFSAGQSIPMHKHEFDHLVYILEAGQLTISKADGTTAVVDGTVGQSLWMPKEVHAAQNTGTTTLRALIIELK